MSSGLLKATGSKLGPHPNCLPQCPQDAGYHTEGGSQEGATPGQSSTILSSMSLLFQPPPVRAVGM